MKSNNPGFENIPLDFKEVAKLRKDFRQGCFTLFIPITIVSSFVCLFSKEVPQDTIYGKLFIWVPLAFLVGITSFLIYHLNNYRLDLKAGKKIFVAGGIDKKYVRVRRKTSTVFPNLNDRMLHFIVVDGKRYLIDGLQYDSCGVDQQVRMYVTPYSRRVLNFELAGSYTDYSQFR